MRQAQTTARPEPKPPARIVKPARRLPDGSVVRVVRTEAPGEREGHKIRTGARITGYTRLGDADVRVRTFPTLASVLRAIGNPEDEPWPMSQSRMDRLVPYVGRGQVANEVRTFQEMLELARMGWKDGAERIHKLRAAYTKRVGLPSEDFTPRRDVVGSDVDMGLFLAGHPEHMTEMPLDMTAKRRIRLTVDVNIACKGCPYRACSMVPIPAQDTFLRGASVAMVAMALEAVGHRVEVVAQTATKFFRFQTDPRGLEDRFVVNEIVLKPAGARVDPARLALTAHGGLVGQLEFAVTDKALRDEGLSQQTYYNRGPFPEGVQVGGFHNYGQRYLGEIRPVPKALRGEIHIDNLHLHSWPSQERAVAWVLKTLTEQGIVVRG